MDGLDQIEAFGIELEKLIGRFHAEFEVPPACGTVDTSGGSVLILSHE